MKAQILLAAISFFAYFSILISIPFLRKNILKKAGKRILKFDCEKNRGMLILFFCAILILIKFFIPISFFSDAIIYLCAIFAATTGMREILIFKIEGLYENAIIQRDQKIFFCDIKSAQILKDENSFLLKIILKNESEKTINFLRKEDCELAKNTIVNTIKKNSIE